jgi:hypothetical protein
METIQQNSLIPVADIQALVTTAPAALQRNELAVTKATQAGQALMNELAANGMSADLDQRMNNYMVKIRTTSEEMKGRRTPLTQFLTKITKAFTSLENQLDKDDPSSIPAAIQKARNDYARFVAEEQKKAEAARQLKLNQDNERINLKSVCEQKIREQFSMLLNGELHRMQMLFNDCTLEKFQEVSDQIRSWNETYPHGHFESFLPDISRQIIYNDKLIEGTIIANAKEGLYDVLYNDFMSAIQSKKQSLVDMLSGKLQSLEAAEKARQEAIAAAELAAKAKSKAEKEAAAAAAEQARIDQERLAAEKKQREEEAARQAVIDEQKREEEAKAQMEMSKSADLANTLFDSSLQAQLEQPTDAPKARTGYSIEVKAQAGWMLIVQRWFQIEGNSMSLDKFEKKTLLQMKSACEKDAFKSGTKIESPLIVYTETFKAVNEK